MKRNNNNSNTIAASGSRVVLLTVLQLLLATSPCATSFEIHTEELLSHSILARLILEAPVRAATRHSSNKDDKNNNPALAFLAKQTIDAQVAFLTERDNTSDSGSEAEPSSHVDKVVDKSQQHQQQPQVPAAFGLGGKYEKQTSW